MTRDGLRQGAFPIACTGREPEWMQVAFALPLHTDCRPRETRIPLNCVDFAENRITFPNPKGGEDRAFSIPMPSALKPTLERQRKGTPPLHGRSPVPAFKALAAVLHQSENAAPLLSLLTRDICQPTAAN